MNEITSDIKRFENYASLLDFLILFCLDKLLPHM